MPRAVVSMAIARFRLSQTFHFCIIHALCVDNLVVICTVVPVGTVCIKYSRAVH